jgi:hypothetical protein
MEALIKGGALSEFCWAYLVGNTMYILQQQVNSHGRFLELSECGGGGRCSFVIVLEGREGRGWANCLSQLRRLEKYYEKKDVGGEQKWGEARSFHGVIVDSGPGRVVARGGVGREGAVLGKSVVEQGQHGLFWTVNAKYGKSWKEGDTFTGRRSRG